MLVNFQNKINPQVSPFCRKCKKELGTYYRCIWQCPLILRYWRNISQELSSIFHKTVKSEPVLLLLNLHLEQLSLSAGQLLLMGKLLLLAMRCDLFQWIEEKPPSVTQWYREIFKVFPLERLSGILRGNANLFYNVWQPFLDHLPSDLANLLQDRRPHFVFTKKL